MKKDDYMSQINMALEMNSLYECLEIFENNVSISSLNKYFIKIYSPSFLSKKVFTYNLELARQQIEATEAKLASTVLKSKNSDMKLEKVRITLDVAKAICKKITDNLNLLENEGGAA